MSAFVLVCFVCDVLCDVVWCVVCGLFVLCVCVFLCLSAVFLVYGVMRYGVLFVLCCVCGCCFF